MPVLNKPCSNPYVERIQDHLDLVFPLSTTVRPNWQAVFPKKQPLVVDIGSGSGGFLHQLACLQPECNYLGIELRFKRLVKSALKCKKTGLTQVRFLQKKAEELGNWLMPESVQQVHINFPDPWPRRRQARNRLLNADFLKVLHGLLKMNASLNFKTDCQFYFEPVLERLQQQPGFTVVASGQDLHNSDCQVENIITEFESIFLQQKQRIYYLKALKTDA